MLWLRKIVAGPKARTVENGYDLDLTYITPRVIAMAFPAEGIEKLYRNSIDDVASYLKDKHDGNFMLYNLSNRKYDYSKFDGMVKQFEWEDHQAPELSTIFEICEHIHNYLKQNEENVVVVHCNHGKGRTGTIIVSLLLFCNFFSQPRWALQYYANRRFEKRGYGVTQPCQIRYIQYFHTLLVEKYVQIKAYSIKRIEFKGQFDIKDCHCIISSVRTKRQIMKTDSFRDGVLEVQQRKILFGDIFLDFRIPGALGIGQRKFARLNLNTIFMPQDLTLRLGVQGISPDNFTSKFKGMVGQDFGIQISFQEYCDCDIRESNEQSRCLCAEQMKQQKKYWQKMYNVLGSYQMPTNQQSVSLLFGEGVNKLGRKKSKAKSLEDIKTSDYAG